MINGLKERVDILNEHVGILSKELEILFISNINFSYSRTSYEIT